MEGEDSGERTETDNKISEYRTLTNRAKRLGRRLFYESLRIAEERGLSVIAVSESQKSNVNADIIVKRYGDEVDARELTELAREDFPVLYRNYYFAKERSERLKAELEEIYDNL